MQKVTNVHLKTIVRATAGAGKTTGLLDAVYKVYKEFFVRNGFPPKILLSTFTIKAANELSERLILKAQDLEDHEFLNFVTSGYLEVGTLHSVFSRILESYVDDRSGDEAKYKSDFHRFISGRAFLHESLKELSLEEELLDGREERALLDLFWSAFSTLSEKPKVFTFVELKASVEEGLARLLNEVGLDLESFNVQVLKDLLKENPKLKKKIKEIESYVNAKENQEDFLQSYSDKHQKLLDLYVLWSQKVDEYLEQESLYGLYDIETRLLRCLDSDKEISKKWDYCFFDEYQDTSPIQEKLISLLTKGSINYYVGDPFQSIYFFRGARKEIFLNEFKTIEEAGGEVEYRLNNYRSAPEIVDFANGLTSFIMPDFYKMTPHKENKGEVKVFYEEEAGIKDEMTSLISEIEKLDLKKQSAVVLSKNNKNLMNCSRKLKQKGIGHHFGGSAGFEGALEIIEMMAFLKFLSKPQDDLNFLVLAMSYWLDIEDDLILKAREEVATEKEASLWDFFKGEESVKNLSELLSLKNKMKPSQLLIDFMCATSFFDMNGALDKNDKRERNILKFLSALENEETKVGFNIEIFCEDIASGRYPFESEEESSESGLVLMTVHGSKGLQFDHVFLFGINDRPAAHRDDDYISLEEGYFALKQAPLGEPKRLFPRRVAKLIESDASEIYEESKRLLYVAMTRAKESLNIFCSGKISKTSAKPNWAKLVLMYLERNGMEESYLFPLETLAIEMDSESPLYIEGGFLLNNKISLGVEEEPSAVTAQEGSKNGTFVKALGYYSNHIRKGVLFHELMERASSLKEAEDLSKVYFGGLAAEDKVALEYLFEQSDFPLTELLESGQKEWGFDTILDEGVSGKIDLWGLIDETVWIVDYKTGRREDSEKGFKQLEAYEKYLGNYLKAAAPDVEFVFKKVLTFPYEAKTFVR